MGEAMNIYLAGPMRGIKDFNFPAFHEAAGELRCAGHEVFSAAAYEEAQFGVGFNKSETGDLKDIAHLKWDFRKAFFKDCEYISLTADAVVVLPGWEKSKGATAEVAIARTLSLQVLNYPGLTPVAGNGGEVRVTDPKTGGQKGTKLERFGLIPVEPLTELARIYGRGARKYSDDNWRRGYDWALSFDALQRHTWQFWGGESIDACKPDCPPDCTQHTNLHHLACATWHCFTLMWFEMYKKEHDHRVLTAKG
jgi:hypothetical protein